MTGAVQRVLAVERNVADLDRAIAFYRDGLGFRVDDVAPDAMPAWTKLPDVCAQPLRAARLLLNAQQIVLTQFPQSTSYPPGSTSADLWFQHCAIVVSEMDVACRRVMQLGATPITREGPQTLPPSTGSVTAFKFSDPDGHPLELIHFPGGTGDPVWQHTHTAQVTLGIDHSAISVANVERSIAFYQLLGFNVAARSVNRGIGQQRLDDLEDVVVDVVALQPADARTPHIELLGYRTPRGRMPRLMNVREIAADRLVLRMQNLHVMADRLSEAKVKPAAHGAAGSTDDPHDLLLRDPDGHWLVLT